MSKRALRFGSTAEMTPGMRRLYEAKLRTPPPFTPTSPRVLGIDLAPDGTTTAVHGETRDGVTVITGVDTIKPVKPSKYGNTATHVDGLRFDSKSEARYYERLKLRVLAGEVRYFLMQVPLRLPGGTRYVVDFMEVHADGSIHWIDVKGVETQVFKIKRREIEATYPIRIEVVK